ncbi:unnamed protein product, partial [Ascophyllum nodosum]
MSSHGGSGDRGGGGVGNGNNGGGVGGGRGSRQRRRRGGRGRLGGGRGDGDSSAPGGIDGDGGAQGRRRGSGGRSRPPRRPPSVAAASLNADQAAGMMGAPSLPSPSTAAQNPVSDSALPSGKANPNSRTSSTTMSQMTDARFADQPLCSPTKRALAEVLRYETMTKVQQGAIPPALAGNDLLAKAKTGTGKTLAFLLPAVEGVARTPRSRRQGISVLIVSPTRELAQQIADEAKQVLTFHDIGLLCVVGGTNIKADIRGFRANPPPDILVATPGRLNDHLENHGLAPSMQSLAFLVFDEADQLLEMGFRPAIEAIMNYLPRRERRQTLLFSATMPTDVEQIARVALKDRYEFVDCVGREENTHQHVPQEFTVCTQENQVQELCQLLRDNMDADPQGHKIIVFFTTARLTQFYAELCNFMGFSVLEIHSRKSQGHRTKVTERFRNGRGLIMFTSDVSARGMDYPDVSAVLQVGLPSDKAQYIHRLGRTARAGKAGHGVLLLCEFESSFLSEVKDLPLQRRERLSEGQVTALTPAINAALDRMDYTSVVCAYQAWLGFYNGQLRRVRWTKDDLVAQANYWITTVCRQPEVPAIQAKTLGKMGLRGVRGIVEERGAAGGGGSGRSGRGRGTPRSGNNFGRG